MSFECVIIAPKGLLCRESKKSDVRPLVTSVCPSVRPCVRSKMSPKIFMKMVPLSGETYFSGSQNGPKATLLAKITKIGTRKVCFTTQRNDFGGWKVTKKIKIWNPKKYVSQRFWWSKMVQKNGRPFGATLLRGCNLVVKFLWLSGFLDGLL